MNRRGFLTNLFTGTLGAAGMATVGGLIGATLDGAATKGKSLITRREQTSSTTTISTGVGATLGLYAFLRSLFRERSQAEENTTPPAPPSPEA